MKQNLNSMNREHMIPPIIQDWLSKIRDKNTPDHIKYNYIQSMKTIVDICSDEIAKYELIYQEQVNKRKR